MPTPLAGQIQVATGAQALSATHVDVTAWILKAPSSNANPVFIGPPGVTASTGHQLDPGDVQEYERNSQNGQPKYQLSPDNVFVCGSSGDRVTWFASPGSGA